MRLQGGDTQYEGRVEIYLNQTWGTICDDSWGIEEANVICRMMNFTKGALSTQCCGFYNSYGVPEKIWLDDVHCVGDEQSIAACRHRGWGRHNCRHREDVGVVCKHPPLSTPGKFSLKSHILFAIGSSLIKHIQLHINMTNTISQNLFITRQVLPFF